MQPASSVSVGNASIFCFAVVLASEYPLVPLVLAQLSQCDDHQLIGSHSNDGMRMVGLFSTQAHNKDNNTAQLIDTWDFVLRRSRLGTADTAFDWYVKVDPDTLLRPTVLRIILRRHSPREALAIGHVQVDGRHRPLYLYGAFQVISRGAADRMVSAGLTRWRHFYHPHDDVWLLHLLQALNITLKTDLHPWVDPHWYQPSLPLSHCSCKTKQSARPQPCKPSSPLSMVYTADAQRVSASSGGFHWDDLHALADRQHAMNINAFHAPWHHGRTDLCISVDAPAYHALKTPQDFKALTMALALWSSLSHLETASLTTRQVLDCAAGAKIRGSTMPSHRARR